MKYPRVLYVGQGQIGYQLSAGFVLASAYANYPPASVTQYSGKSVDSVPVGSLIPIRPFKESSFSLPIFAVVRGIRLIRRIMGLPQYEYISSIKSFQSSLMERLYANLWAAYDIAPLRLPKRTKFLLEKQKPQVIHALIGDARTIQRALKVSKRLNLPVVPFITDDWPATIFLNNELWGKARKRTLNLLNQLLERSPVLLVTGEAMAREYSSRYKKPCFIATASVDPKLFIHAYQERGEKRRLVYVGSPHIGRAELADQVALFAKSRGWEVHIYPINEQAWKNLSSEVEVQQQQLPEDVPLILCQADALLFQESLDPEIAAYTRLSVSGKLSQLVAAARPILAIGPDGQGSIEELRANAQRVFILHKISDDELGKAFDYLESNLGPAQHHIPNHYLSKHLREVLVDALNQAISLWNLTNNNLGKNN